VATLGPLSADFEHFVQPVATRATIIDADNKIFFIILLRKKETFAHYDTKFPKTPLFPINLYYETLRHMTIIVSNHSTESFGWQRWHVSRPDRLNAIGVSIAKELTDTLELARRQVNTGIRAVVITAESQTRGDRVVWIAGGDLKELSELSLKREGGDYARSMRLFCEGLEYLPFPVITVVDGAAIGGGAELALAGDVRFATVRSSFEFKQLKIGLATGYGAASRLTELLGKSRAQSLLFFAETLDAEVAHQSGLVHRLITSSSVEDIGKAILPILQLEPAAVFAQKKMLRCASSAAGANHSWSDEIFESIWMNETHSKNLESFKKR
jgi:enoyl-CoA hydratase/carnithine racemase